ncbi:MAG: hypothetical protein IKX98_02635, partial [Clostridia bacterium]|nr:hypothetical protein [Clostridia bacterium]
KRNFDRSRFRKGKGEKGIIKPPRRRGGFIMPFSPFPLRKRERSKLRFGIKLSPQKERFFGRYTITRNAVLFYNYLLTISKYELY